VTRTVNMKMLSFGEAFFFHNAGNDDTDGLTGKNHNPIIEKYENHYILWIERKNAYEVSAWH